MPVPLPPLPEQRRIASILDAAQNIAAHRAQSLEALQLLRFSILTDALSRASFVPLGERLVFLTSGSRGWAKHYARAGAPFLRIQNVKADSIALGDLAHVNAPRSREAERTKVQVGDVLLSITADLGRSAVVDERVAGGHVSQHLAILRTVGLHPRILSAYLSSHLGLAQMMRLNRGATKQGLNFDDIRSLRVPILDSDVEAKTVGQLEDIDYLKAKYRKHGWVVSELSESIAGLAFKNGNP
jgi:type I restriction enzyme S subunit